LWLAVLHEHDEFVVRDERRSGATFDEQRARERRLDDRRIALGDVIDAVLHHFERTIFRDLPVNNDLHVDRSLVHRLQRKQERLVVEFVRRDTQLIAVVFRLRHERQHRLLESIREPLVGLSIGDLFRFLVSKQFSVTLRSSNTYRLAY
jgi:hypothetical protein